MLTARQLHIAGRHHTLVPATTLEAHRGQVLLVQADGQERRTALSLALAGRMKPTTGSVVLGHQETIAILRKRSAIIDSPDVNEPENHLTVRSLVSEDLALVPLKFRDRTRPTAWLVKHGFRDILDKWVGELEPDRLLHLQLELALADRDVDLLVVDSPDRHAAEDGAWLALLEQAAAGMIGKDPDANSRELIVLGVVGRIPEGWTGPTAAAGQAMEPAAEPADTPVPTSVETPAAGSVETTEPDTPVAGPDETRDIPGSRQARSPEEARSAEATTTEGEDVQ